MILLTLSTVPMSRQRKLQLFSTLHYRGQTNTTVDKSALLLFSSLLCSSKTTSFNRWAKTPLSFLPQGACGALLVRSSQAEVSPLNALHEVPHKGNSAPVSSRAENETNEVMRRTLPCALLLLGSVLSRSKKT